MIVSLILLGACDEDTSDEGLAVEVAREHLEAHDNPANALVSVHVANDYGWSMAWGRPAVDGFDLSAWLASCAVAPGLQVDATLLVAAGGYPWTILETRGAPLDACLTDRLRRLPVEEPVVQGARDVWVVRYQAGEVGATGGTASVAPGEDVWSAAPSPAPPNVLYRDDGAIESSHIRFDRGMVTWAQKAGHRLATWDPEALARQVRCPAATLSLVRVVVELQQGSIVDVQTAPEDACVEGRVEEAAPEVRAVVVEAEDTVGDVDSALLVFDVPVGAW